MSLTEEQTTILAILDGWQQGCWTMARTRKPFKVEGINPISYKAFCDSICATYGYQTKVIGHTVSFIPRT